jgi:hemoglobin-like flavoprotein
MSTTPAPEPQALNVNLLLSSFMKIEPQATEFATTFYQILFNKYPQTRKLFLNTDMDKQKNKLIESLQLVMVNVHNSDALTSILKNLGKRHVQYGAVLNDYPLIGDALLQALERHLGRDWNADVQQTWTSAYQLIADTMSEGAKSVSERNENPLHIPLNQSNVPEPASQQNRLESGSQTNAKSNTSSGGKSVLATLMLLSSLGIIGLFGYVLWNAMNTPTNPSTPNPAKQDR